MGSERGFTLLELLVTIVIVVASSAVILAHLRTLMDYRERVQRHQMQIIALQNSAAKLPYLPYEKARLHQQKGRLQLSFPDRSLPQLEVRNFSAQGAPRVEVDLAYSPYQTFTIPGSNGAKGTTFLFQGLKKPSSE